MLTNYDLVAYKITMQDVLSKNMQDGNTLFRTTIAKTGVVNFSDCYACFKKGEYLNGVGNLFLGLMAGATTLAYPKDHKWQIYQNPQKINLSNDACLILKAITIISIINASSNQFSDREKRKPGWIIETGANTTFCLAPLIKTGISLVI